jgi:hypothetical protein
MKFKYFINESDKNIYKEIAKAIKANKLTGDFLYRGMKNKPEIGMSVVRKDRVSLDTDNKIHNLFNDNFLEKFNIKLRSSTVFVTKNARESLTYGTTYIIIPKEKAEYYYNENVKDLWSSTERFIRETPEKMKELIKKMADGYEKANNPKYVRNKDCEIMIDCDNYYYMSLNAVDYESIYNGYESLYDYCLDKIKNV